MSAGPASLPRSLFGDGSPDYLFDLSTNLVPLTLLTQAAAPPARPGFLTPEALQPPPGPAAAPPPAAPQPAAPQPAAAEPAPAAPIPPLTTTLVPGTGPLTSFAAPPALASLGAADQAMNGAWARQFSHASGAGVVIGILSDSFNLAGGYTSDIARGLLGPGVTIMKEGPGGGHDEGRAMAQLIHQIAPAAQILFYTGFGGQADFAHGIEAMVSAGANIIVDDVTYLNEPFYQDGAPIQAAVAGAVAAGVSYFTSASNQGGNFFESAFTPLTTALPGLTGAFVAANFATEAAPQSTIGLTIARGATLTLDLQWDAPFASIGASGGAATSLGMVLYDLSGRIVAYALRNQVGSDPVSLLQYANNTGATDFRLAVITDGGQAPPGRFKFIAYGGGTRIDDARAGHGSGSIIGHEMVPEANTVGAIAWHQTHSFGGGGAVEDFTSRGPGTYLFDAAGNRLTTPIDSTGVDYVAPDGSATSVFDPFYGTSAAAPNAAAVAALMLQKAPNLTPEQVSAILARSAAPVSGPAGSAGAGLIDAAAAVKMAMALAGPAGRSHSLRIGPQHLPMPGVALSSGAIRNAADALLAAHAAMPDGAPCAADAPLFSAAPDFASGLVLAAGDSLGGAAYGSLALMHHAALGPDGFGDPVHLLT